MVSRNWSIAVGFCLLGLVFAHHPMLFSGLERIQIDHEDSRLVNYLLEHGYQWLRRNPLHNDVWSPPFFFPARHALAYSDSLVSAGPLYWPWRILGIPPDTSFQLWMMTCLVLNNLCFFVLLRTVFRLGVVPAAMGAFLFAFGGPRVADLGHPQLLPQFFTVLAILAVSWVTQRRALSRPRRLACWMIAGLAAAAQLYASFYLGWFLVLATALAVAWGLISRATRETLLDVLKRDWLLILAASVIPAILTMDLLSRYLDVARVAGYRRVEEVKLAIPLLRSWLYMGPESWIYGWLSGVPYFMGYRHMEPAHRIGLGWLTTPICLVGLLLGRDRPSVRLFALTGLTLLAAVTRIPRWLIEGTGLASWMLSLVIILCSRDRPRDRAWAVTLLALLSLVLFPPMTLLLDSPFLVFSAVLGRLMRQEKRRSLWAASAGFACLFPVLTTFGESPVVLLTATLGAILVIILHRWTARSLTPSLLVLPAVLASAAILVVPGEMIVWWSIYEYFPGGAAIRVTSRACLVLLVPMAIGFGIFWQRPVASARSITGMILGVLCLMEQGMTTTTSSKGRMRTRVESIASRLRDAQEARAFFYSPRRSGLDSWNDHVDAMWAGLACGVPTINGYSGQTPPGWAPLHASAIGHVAEYERVRAALLAWTRMSGLTPIDVAWITDDRALALTPSASESTLPGEAGN